MLADAVETARRVRAGESTAEESIAAAVARARALEPALNAIVEPAYDTAIALAGGAKAGALAGVPVLLKDLFCPAAGEPAYHANSVLKGLDHRHSVTGAVARRLADAGAISLGRSHSPEFGCGNCTASAETVLYGATRNPWDPARTPLGSSGGAAAAVAAGIVPLAHASDGGGSIRIPASACALVGLKPSRGRVSHAPAGEVWAGGVSDGVLSRTVRDTALGLDVLAGPEPGDPYGPARPGVRYLDEIGRDPGRLRVGFYAALPYVDTHRACRDAVHAAGRLLEGLGHDVEEAHPASLERLDFMHDYMLVIRVSLAAELERVARELGRAWRSDDVEDGTWRNYQRGLEVSAVDYASARERLHRFTRDTLGWWAGGFDLLLTPTLAIPPPPRGWLVESEDRERLERLGATIPYTPQFNVTGQPAISLPLAWTADGLPIGIQLVAAPGCEDRLLRLAACLEDAAPWRDRRPIITA